ncbi:Sec-independent protein translocase protein TatB [Alphaproteobacteria bacterium]|nr:Sec-independent protein translocase protein TatB [Alphaproteobacteria bacterium]
MFDIGWQEMLVVCMVTLLIVGPKDIPKVIKTVRDGMKQVRGLANEFQSGMDDLVREADLEDTKKILKNASTGSLEKTIRETVDPKGELEQDIGEIKSIENDYKRSTFTPSSEPVKADVVKEAKAEAEIKPKSEPKTEAKKPAAKAKTATAKKAPAKKAAPKKAAVKTASTKTPAAKAKTEKAKPAKKS